METLKCCACGGTGLVIGIAGSAYDNTLGGWYPNEVDEMCTDCHGTGELCCAGCGSAPEVEDLEHGQPWCTKCWLAELESRRTLAVRPYTDPFLSEEAEWATPAGPTP